MKKERITYVKRCLNLACLHRNGCEHGKAHQRFQQQFPQGIKEIPLDMTGNFRAIYPVAYGCPRHTMTREEIIRLQGN